MPRLEKYIKQIRGVSYSPEDISDVPVIDYLPILKANNIQEGSLKTDNLIYVHKSKIKPEQLIKKGDILIAASSGSKDSVGKSVFFDEDFNGGFGAFCKVIRPVANIYPKFVSVFFKTPEYRRHISRVIQGANINNLRTEDIDSLQIPIFPPSEQIKIAQILTQTEKLIAQRKESIAMLDEYLKSTFLEMFGDVKGSTQFILDDLKSGGNETFSNGPFGSDLLTSDLKGAGVPVVYIRDLKNGTFQWKSNVFVSIEKANELKNCHVLSEDILISKVGDPPGLSTIYPKNLGLSIITQDVIRIRVNKNIINPSYLKNYLNSDLGKQLIKKITIQGTRNRFSLGEFKRLFIPVPPITLQTQFAQIVEKTEALKSQYQRSLQELEQLFGSLSQRAFKGELDLSRMEVLEEEVLQIRDTSTSTTIPKSEKRKKEPLQPTQEIEATFSIWQSQRGKRKAGKIPFNSIEGNAVLSTEFTQKAQGFSFQQFEAFLKNEGFDYAYEQVKDFLFEKLEQKELKQYYATQEWMEQRKHTGVNPDPTNFSDDGHIWLVPNNARG